MAIFTDRYPIFNIISEFWMIRPGLDMMCIEFFAMRAAALTSIVISFENRCSPLYVWVSTCFDGSISFASLITRMSFAALKMWRTTPLGGLRPNLDSLLEYGARFRITPLRNGSLFRSFPLFLRAVSTFFRTKGLLCAFVCRKFLIAFFASCYLVKVFSSAFSAAIFTAPARGCALRYIKNISAIKTYFINFLSKNKRATFITAIRRAIFPTPMLDAMLCNHECLAAILAESFDRFWHDTISYIIEETPSELAALLSRQHTLARWGSWQKNPPMCCVA